MRILYIILFISIFGCNTKVQDNLPSSSGPVEIIEVETIKDENVLSKSIDIEFTSLDRNLLLTKLFPEGVINDTDIVWFPSYDDFETFDEQISDDSLCHTKLDTILEIGNSFFVFFLTDRYYNGEIESCHPCAPIVGIAEFKKSEKGYTFVKFKRNVFQHGTNGYGSDFEIETLNKNLRLLKVSSGWVGGGGIYEYIDYYSLTSFKEVFSYTKFESNGGLYEDETDSNYVETSRQFKVKGQNFILISKQKKYDNSIKAHKVVTTTEYYDYDFSPEMFIKKCQ